jgi:hypothetical protein
LRTSPYVDHHHHLASGFVDAVYAFSFFAFAQRVFCAAAIFALPAALMLRRFALTGATVVTAFTRGLPGPFFGAWLSLSNAFACWRRAISESISETILSKLNSLSWETIGTAYSLTTVVSVNQRLDGNGLLASTGCRLPL